MATEHIPAHAIDDGYATTRKRTQRTSVEYQLIFGMCLLNFMVTGLIERLNPFYWLGRAARAPGASWWTQARDAAQRCSSMAFKG